MFPFMASWKCALVPTHVLHSCCGFVHGWRHPQKNLLTPRNSTRRHQRQRIVATDWQRSLPPFSISTIKQNTAIQITATFQESTDCAFINTCGQTFNKQHYQSKVRKHNFKCGKYVVSKNIPNKCIKVVTLWCEILMLDSCWLIFTHYLVQIYFNNIFIQL